MKNINTSTSGSGTPGQGVAQLATMVGRRTPGGCPDCHAYLTVESDHAGRGVLYRLSVHHDACCPALGAMRAKV